MARTELQKLFGTEAPLYKPSVQWSEGHTKIRHGKVVCAATGKDIELEFRHRHVSGKHHHLHGKKVMSVGFMICRECNDPGIPEEKDIDIDDLYGYDLP